MEEHRLLQETLLKSESEFSNELLDEDGDDHVLLIDQSWFHKGRSLRLATLGVILLALAVSLVINAVLWSRAKKLDTDAICNVHTSQSRPPLLDKTRMTYSTVDFNGTFAKQNIYRQAPSPEVDAAWEALGTDYRPLIIKEGQEAFNAGLKPGYHIKRSPELGGGFPVQNLLRQTLYWNYDYYNEKGTGAFMNDDGPFRSHIGHCVDILRQQLVCTADFNVFGQVWVTDIDAAFPDFMTKHKCKDFNAIRQWAHDGQITEKQMQDERFLMRAAGDVAVASIP
ncbi:hypothetical protein LTR97_005105 [Elasticomyces elasticus]|uniref:Tat pathway signal sequence n=1 Tax=Elasticomyces elasticus TaxID=574655 RepID=A0AAN7WJN2_9PEZI|nr:hypothetical protein LTR97_005105 [Elasticomyces elasticus]